MHTSYKSIFSLHVLKEKAGDLFIPCCFSYCCIHTLVLLVSHRSKEVSHSGSGSEYVNDISNSPQKAGAA